MDEAKSIEELEKDYWKDVDFPTSLVEKCFQYRRIPIKDLTVEQIRLLLGQKIGIKYLLPKALLILQENILAEGDCYPGDLLACVLRLDISKWKEHYGLQHRFDDLLTLKKSEIQNSEDRQLLKMIADYEEH